MDREHVGVDGGNLALALGYPFQRPCLDLHGSERERVGPADFTPEEPKPFVRISPIMAGEHLRPMVKILPAQVRELGGFASADLTALYRYALADILAVFPALPATFRISH